MIKFGVPKVPKVPKVFRGRSSIRFGYRLKDVLKYCFPVIILSGIFLTTSGRTSNDKSRTNQGTFQLTHCLVESQGAILRMDTTRKVIYLVSSADEFAEGAGKMLDILAAKKVKASFFLTGNFLRNQAFQAVIARMHREGHYLGPHSDKHLLYNAWEKRDSLLVTHEEFSLDLSANLKELYKRGIRKKEVRAFLPPYEWYNHDIAAWSREQGLQMVNFTPGTGTNADYTTPDMANYRTSDQLFDRLFNFEKTNRLGLRGAIILIHMGTHPDRTDKFYDKLGQLIDELKARGYEFGRM